MHFIRNTNEKTFTCKIKETRMLIQVNMHQVDAVSTFVLQRNQNCFENPVAFSISVPTTCSISVQIVFVGGGSDIRMIPHCLVSFMHAPKCHMCLAISEWLINSRHEWNWLSVCNYQIIGNHLQKEQLDQHWEITFMYRAKPCFTHLYTLMAYIRTVWSAAWASAILPRLSCNRKFKPLAFSFRKTDRFLISVK